MSGKLTASCMSTRTATLLLVVDRYSQVLGAAVHDYSQLIRKPQPLPNCHDPTQTRNSTRFAKQTDTLGRTSKKQDGEKEEWGSAFQACVQRYCCRAI